jgi:spoIIIJ-associated protein
MEWIELTGKTVEAAVEAALDELGVDESDLEYEVLEEPKRGLLSRLSGNTGARIRARVKPISREKPDRRRRRQGGRDEGGSGGRERRAGGSGRTERAPRPDRPDKPERAAAEQSRPPSRPSRPAAAREAEASDESAEDVSPGPVARNGESGGSASAGARNRNRSRKRKPSGGQGEDSGRAAAESNREDSTVSATAVSLEEQVELAENFTRGLVERFGFPVEVSAQADGDEDVLVDVRGEDLGLLIGPKAATLEAVQEVVRIMVHHRIGGHGARIHVDVAGYRARRQAALADFARQAAARALESGRDQVFEPMSPADRKVVHDTVSAIDGVETFSEGEEPRRRVVIKAS